MDDNRIRLGDHRRPQSNQIHSNWVATPGSATRAEKYEFFSRWDKLNEGSWDVWFGVWQRRYENDENPITKVPLWRGAATSRIGVPYLYVSNDRLYIAGQRTMVFDISDPVKPRRLIDLPEVWRPAAIYPTDHSIKVPLPPAPGLSMQQRLAF